MIDLGDRRIVIAGDAAFDGNQVTRGTIPEFVEKRAATLHTYDMLRRAR